MERVIEFNKKCIPASDYVVINILNRNDDMKIGGVMIAQSAFSNERTAFGKVLAVGKNAEKEYGLKEGDYCVFDRLACVHQTAPICVVKYVNVIALTNSDYSTFSPLKNMVFVRDEKETTQNIDGVLINNYNKSLRIGKIVAMNILDDIDVPYKKGDLVMISKGGDSFQVGSEHVFIYKHDMLVCKVEDEKYDL